MAIHVTPKLAREFTQIAKLSLGEFKTLAAKIDSFESPSIRMSILFEFLTEHTDPEYASVLIRQLIGLSRFRRKRGKTSAETSESLLDGILDSELDEETKTWFRSGISDFESMLGSDWVRLSSKALDLNTDFDKIFTSSNVVTDIRPVFDGPRELVKGGIITQTLRLSYVSNENNGNRCELSLALDKLDIDLLIAELQKAAKKAENLSGFLNERGLFENYLSGDETYDFS